MPDAPAAYPAYEAFVRWVSTAHPPSRMPDAPAAYPAYEAFAGRGSAAHRPCLSRPWSVLRGTSLRRAGCRWRWIADGGLVCPVGRRARRRMGCDDPVLPVPECRITQCSGSGSVSRQRCRSSGDSWRHFSRKRARSSGGSCRKRSLASSRRRCSPGGSSRKRRFRSSSFFRSAGGRRFARGSPSLSSLRSSWPRRFSLSCFLPSRSASRRPWKVSPSLWKKGALATPGE